MAAPPEMDEVKKRVLGQYLPAWCASPRRPQLLDPSGFKPPDWSFLTPGLAHWFLIAIDKGVVEVTSDSRFMRGSSHSEGIFEHGWKDTYPRQSKLRVESFFEIAAVGLLAVRYGWPVERLRFQSPDVAFDFLAYVDEDWDRSGVAIAGEAKQRQSEAEKLKMSLEVCGALGDHEQAVCSVLKNHHKKYLGLLNHRPRILWIVGPEGFTAADPDLVFRVEASSGSVVRLRRTDASQLHADATPSNEAIARR